MIRRLICHLFGRHWMELETVTKSEWDGWTQAPVEWIDRCIHCGYRRVKSTR